MGAPTGAIAVAPMDATAADGPRPRVALLAHDVHDGGGMERTFAELIRRAHAEIDFVVVSSELAADLRPLVEWRPVPIPRRPFTAKFLAFFVRAPRRLRGADPDIVHAMGAIVPLRVDLASVHYCHAAALRATGAAPRQARLWRRANAGVARLVSLAVERWCYRPARAGLLATVSRGTRDEVGRWYPRMPVVVTPNGVDAARYAPDARVRAQLRAQLAAGADDVVALFVGGDWDRKGLHLAIEALALARARVTGGLALWVVGEGDEARAMELARRHGVDGAVRMLGPRPDVERYYQAADLLVLPTAYETFSLVAYEAAAAGIPVIATPVSGIDELIGDGEAGVPCARRADEVADALALLAGDPARRRAMGREARRRSAEFTWERSVDSVLHAYERVLAGRGGGA